MRSEILKVALFCLILPNIIAIACSKNQKGIVSKKDISHQISKHSETSKFISYKGLVMAGYQGWFNAPADGANRGWNHYRKGNLFEPGACTIDLWPDMTEYKDQYKTSFQFADGKPAYVFSSYDRSTTDLHFKWMREYNIDGVFIQRFISTLKNAISFKHNNTVLNNAYNAAENNGRAIAVMYDLSGSKSDGVKAVIDDWKYLVDSIKVTGRGKQQSALYHNGKPLVVIWGVGFGDGRAYSTKDVEKVVDFLKNDPVYGGCSIMLGVPTYWRTFGRDTEKNPELHTLLKKIDIIHPWFVGRYNEKSYPGFKQNIVEDIAWCKANKIDYVPVVFPGFSWHNMNPEDQLDAIPRNKGNFYWAQLSGVLEMGAEMIYVAMFDEIDEATAIFKVAHEVPVGASRFVPLEKEVPTDHYLWLTGQASKMLKKEVPFQKSIPSRIN
jgi:glycoprotein endo-alpha-1,2-mannosidase